MFNFISLLKTASLPRKAVLFYLMFLLLCVGLIFNQANAQNVLSEESESQLEAPQQRAVRAERGGRRVYRDRVDPHWFANATKFWYRNNLEGDAKEFIVVDAEKGSRELVFDHQAVATAIGAGTDSHRLPIRELEFSDDGSKLFLVGDKRWEWIAATNTLVESNEPSLTKPTESNAAPMRSRALQTGADTEISFENKTAASIEIFWIAGDGPRTSYGKIGPGSRKDQHTFGGHRWAVVNEKGDELGIYEATDRPTVFAIDGTKRATPIPAGRRNRARSNEPESGRSPDGKWNVFIRDHNVVLKGEDVLEIALSQDGVEGNAYGQVSWSPDSKTVIAFRIESGDAKEVHLVQSSPENGGRAVLQSRPYALPGDKFATYELNLFQLAPREQKKPQTDRFESEFARPRLRWTKAGSHFIYQQTDRGHQRFRLIEVEAKSGNVRNIIDEKSPTFIWTAHTDNVSQVTWLESGEQLLYVSEQSGWRHIYLVDAATGSIINPVTAGDWVFRGIEEVDEVNRQLWFRASGCFAGQDPYLIHYGRVNFDGSGLVWLTEADGNHTIQYSPDRKYLIDSYSRVDLAPVTELRRVADGKMVCSLEKSDIRSLSESGWTPPKVLSAKGRDGKTDIWGIVSLPRDFDPNKKYPVIEDIYAGPHGSHVPKSFSPSQRFESLTELGFIVVKIDGMGTANRSKAFHDVCWHNIKDAGFEDRILWIKAAASVYPQMDLSRVGIYGTSAGGQNAATAVLLHSEFYKAAVAACGCHDNRMDKASWNEQWMGYPVGPHYNESSNIDNAHRLGGKLLLIVGEMDTNVPPESSLRFADKLIKADKDFDLLIVPNAGHGMGGAYGQRKMHEFFVRHLLGKDSVARLSEP